MASIFGHAVSAIAVGSLLPKELRQPKILIFGIICSIIPDADVIGFMYGIDYASMWGHRGITHSIFGAIIFSIFVVMVFNYKAVPKLKWKLILFYFTCTVSHGLLDALTTGGKGVAFFAPFDVERYFLPYRVIAVSPIGASKFFSEWGLKVLTSEMYWIGIPSMLLIGVVFIFRMIGNRKYSQ